MTGGGKLDLDRIQADDELLDMLAKRENMSGDEGFEALLGAWAREIDEDAEEMAGTPMSWMGHRRPKVRALRLHRSAAVAGALAVTLSGGMAAAALMSPESMPAPMVAVSEAIARIMPKQPHVAATAAGTTGQALAAAPAVIGTETDDAEVAPSTGAASSWTPSVLAPSAAQPAGIPPLTPVPGDVVPSTVAAPVEAAPETPAAPAAPQPSAPATVPSTGGSSAPVQPSAPQSPTSTPTSTTPTSGGTGSSAQPTPTTNETPTPPSGDIKESAPVSTPGGVFPIETPAAGGSATGVATRPAEQAPSSVDTSAGPGAHASVERLVTSSEAAGAAAERTVERGSRATPAGTAATGGSTMGE